MKTLIIVDYQYDFYHPKGALYIPGAELCHDSIKYLIANDDFDDIIFTLDWHPYNHCSFKENGGQWKRHCVQFTQGASIPYDLVEVANFVTKRKPISNPIKYWVKGTDSDREEYAPNINGDTARWYSNSQIVVCGVAGDVCVLNTIKKLIDYELDVSYYMPGIACIDWNRWYAEISYLERMHYLKQYYGANN